MMERKQNNVCKEADDQAEGFEQVIREMASELTGFSKVPLQRPSQEANGAERPLVQDKSKGAGCDSTSDPCTDLPNPQGPAVEAGAPPSPEEVKARIKARLRYQDRPLAALASKEAALHERSVALANLSSTSRTKVPDKELLAYQLSRAVHTSRVPRTIAPNLRKGAFALFSALRSEDPVESEEAAESIVDRAMVALGTGVMDCHARVAESRDPKALGIYFRHIEKGTRLLLDLTEARATRRGAKKITVANVNVEAGGQAIVGNLETQKRRSENENDDEADR